ncbi:hypothetical protein COO60DRAFT_1488380 [Scenedesmus sp. NREL 46B-D3]|nr:hypothetical protein COO60DRAFT_1488380 [Scenedesmus sp. NREL 46B-D3]
MTCCLCMVHVSACCAVHFVCLLYLLHAAGAAAYYAARNSVTCFFVCVQESCVHRSACCLVKGLHGSHAVVSSYRGSRVMCIYLYKRNKKIPCYCDKAQAGHAHSMLLPPPLVVACTVTC